MMHITIPTKPLSVNQAWKGKRFKTEKYDEFTDTVDKLLLMNRKPEIPDGDLEIHFMWGLSTYKQSDYDNPIKCAQDRIANWLKIDDNRFVGGSQRKVKVSKGDEFIVFMIRPYNPVLWDEFTEMEHLKRNVS